MALEIRWTRKALGLPPEVRRELERRLNLLSAYFPEMKRKLAVGITRSFDGLAFQSDDGHAKLMVDVHRSRGGGWRYPTSWTMAHELMHLAQFNASGVPAGERACDVHALARLPPRLIDDSPSYLVVPPRARKAWGTGHARLAHDLAKEALKRRAKGLRRYAVWWEQELERKVSR